MRTDELIRAMAADTAPRPAARAGAGRDDGRRSRSWSAPSRWRCSGSNPDLGAMMTGPLMLLRQAFPLLLALGAALLALRLARPGAGSGPTRLHARRRGGRSPPASCCASSRWCRPATGGAAAMGGTADACLAVGDA